MFMNIGLFFIEYDYIIVIVILYIFIYESYICDWCIIYFDVRIC